MNDARRRLRHLAGDASMREPFHALYLAAMNADDHYRDTIYRYCKRKNRYSITKEEQEIPAIKAAYQRKVEADRVWLSALRRRIYDRRRRGSP